MAEVCQTPPLPQLSYSLTYPPRLYRTGGGGVFEVTFIEGLLWARRHVKDFKFITSSHLLQNLSDIGVRISFLLIRYQIITYLVT